MTRIVPRPCQSASPRGSAPLRRRLALDRRKEELERRSLPDLAVDLDGALVPPHDPEHGAEPEAAAGELGREERVEDALDHLAAHSRAVVGDLEEDVVAVGQVALDARALPVLGVDDLRARGQRDRAGLIAQGLARVEHEVHEHLPDLRRVEARDGQAGRQVVAHRRLPADAQVEQLHGLAHQLAQIDELHEELALAGVGEHLAAQVGRAARGDFDLRDLLLGARVRRQVHRARGSPSRGCPSGCC